jgi:outer membrane protein insertion porin family
MIALGILVLAILSDGELDVGEIVIANNTALPTERLLSVVETRVGTPYRADVADGDAARLERLYRERGYLQASVVHKRSLLEEPGTLRITFVIEEGEPTTIVGWRVTGNRSVRTGGLERVLSDLKGSPLDLGLLGAAVRELRALYVQGTRPYATVAYEAVVDTLAKTASVVFHVREGPSPVITDIEVEGAHDVKERVILREVRLRRGSTYDGDALRISRYRIHELGLFRSVVFTLPGMEAAEESLRLVIRVDEAATRWVEVATGYGSPDRLRVTLGVGHDNIGGAARSVSLRGKVSYGWELDRFVGRVEAGAQDPWIFGVPVAAGLDAFAEERAEMDSRFRKFGGALRLGKQWTERTQSSLILSVERRRTLSLGEDASEELKEEAERQVTNSVIASQRFDFRDSPVEPSRGVTFTLTAREAGGILGGDNHFRMFTAEFAWFHPLPARLIAGGRARLGLAGPFGSSPTVPFEERFRAGGAHTVRGYPEEGLGPLDDNGEPLGGEQIILTSGEVRFPVLGKLWGGVFLDGGQVWARAGEAAARDLRWGAGVGARYLTFIGPLRLDWAVPLPHGKGRIYVAVGHAF